MVGSLAWHGVSRESGRSSSFEAGDVISNEQQRNMRSAADVE